MSPASGKRSSGRRVVLAALNQLYVEDVKEAFLPFSYGARRVQAALVHPPIDGCEVTLLESTTLDPEETADQIAKLRPDLVGFSTYLWSFPTFCEAARILKSRLPGCTIVFGGPSSRPAMMDHAAFAFAREFVDALVVREGEQVIRALVMAQDRSPEALARIPGLVLPRGPAASSGWLTTPSPELVPMDSLPSPHQIGLVPDGITANLETFRGCPLACAFCEWGVYEGTNRVFSADYLTRELEAFKRSGARGAYLVDAGFSLNRRAFRNLVAAEKQVRFLAEQPLACEVYASNLTDEDAEFLAQVNVGRIGVGLQTFNPDVLRLMQRPFSERRFLQGVDLLKRVCGGVALEIILGLPGDNPASFKETVRRCMDLEAGGVHVFHALVLPDGLMTRAPEGADVRFDPKTLKMTSCSTWSERDLGETIEWMSRVTEAAGGVAEASFWKLPLVRARTDDSRFLSVPEIFLHKAERSTGYAIEGDRRPTSDTVAGVDGDALHAYAEAVLTRSGGTWRTLDARADRRTLTVRMSTPHGPLEADVSRQEAGQPCFGAALGFAVSHRAPPPGFSQSDYGVLRGLVEPLATLAASLWPAEDPVVATPSPEGARSPGVVLPVLRGS